MFLFAITGDQRLSRRASATPPLPSRSRTRAAASRTARRVGTATAAVIRRGRGGLPVEKPSACGQIPLRGKTLARPNSGGVPTHLRYRTLRHTAALAGHAGSSAIFRRAVFVWSQRLCRFRDVSTFLRGLTASVLVQSVLTLIKIACAHLISVYIGQKSLCSSNQCLHGSKESVLIKSESVLVQSRLTLT